MSRLPDSGRYDILAVMSLGGIRSEDHVFGASIWAQEDQAEWVTAVEVPHFIEGESMEERVAQGFFTVESDHRGSSRPPWQEFQGRPVGLDEESAFDRKRFQLVALDQGLDFCMHG